LTNNRITGVNYDSNYAIDPTHHKVKSTLYAKKGVIVATGGYAADAKFIHNHVPHFPSSFLTTNKKTTSAELLQSCMDLHCATIHLDKIQWMPWTTQNENGYGIGGLFGDYIVSSNGILIDCSNGLRFVNECGNRKQVTEEILRVQNVIGLVDSLSVIKSGWNLERALKMKIVLSFNSLQELAQYYSIPLNSLNNSLNEYNTNLILKRKDSFGKVFETWMTPIQNPPYYAMSITPKTHYSLGGLVTDIHTNVLDINNNPISGLYAIGEVTGLTHGANRLGSCSVTECLVMGRIAGKKILDI
jgi:flavocytochrome c